MKLLTSVFVAACLMAGCVAGSTVPHDDSPGAVKRDEGPVLCRDGTTPPCNDRDCRLVSCMEVTKVTSKRGPAGCMIGSEIQELRRNIA